MEERTTKSRSRTKSGPLKSSPGFLKCMRSVYLFFKEEKEKGALNIPINSFIERTAVACGVGRGTLYNYAKKGLFDEHPALLLPKKRKKKPRNKPTQVEAAVSVSDDGDCEELNPPIGTSSASNQKKGRSVEVQTDADVFLAISVSPPPSASHLATPRVEKVAVGRIPGQEVGGPWAGGNSARRDIDYFTKTNIWQNVYSINPADINGTEITPARMGNCQPTSSHLTDL